MTLEPTGDICCGSLCFSKCLIYGVYNTGQSVIGSCTKIITPLLGVVWTVIHPTFLTSLRVKCPGTSRKARPSIWSLQALTHSMRQCLVSTGFTQRNNFNSPPLSPDQIIIFPDQNDNKCLFLQQPPSSCTGVQSTICSLPVPVQVSNPPYVASQFMYRCPIHPMYPPSSCTCVQSTICSLPVPVQVSNPPYVASQFLYRCQIHPM